MPITLPAALIAKKNALAGDGAWLTLFEITAPTEVLRLVPNTDDVGWGGHTWEAFPLEVGEIRDGSDGAFTSFTVSVSNVTRAIQPYLEDANGLVGCAVRLIVINSAALAADVSDLVVSYEILGAKADEMKVTFTLGRPSLLSRRFPLYQALPRTCPVAYRSARCGYGGPLPSCDNTLDDCRTHGNQVRFAGRPGLQAKGARYL